MTYSCCAFWNQMSLSLRSCSSSSKSLYESWDVSRSSKAAFTFARFDLTSSTFFSAISLSLWYPRDRWLSPFDDLVRPSTCPCPPWRQKMARKRQENFFHCSNQCRQKKNHRRSLCWRYLYLRANILRKRYTQCMPLGGISAECTKFGGTKTRNKATI